MPLSLSANTVQEALDRADSRHWTRQPPRSDTARLRFLLRHTGSIPALAKHLATEDDILHRTLSGHRLASDHPVRATLEREVIRLWQPRIRRLAHRTIIDNAGLMTVAFRAWFGFTAAAGTTDDPRLRFLTLSLKEPYPELLFAARHREAPEEELHQILSTALAACYFHRDARPAALEEVTLKSIDFLEFYY
ncbi:hypothetical protein ABZ353_27965 [Streptomyces niveus]|uniref:telomere-protecting terminal protein Tpg n=1 Tax=Streptomyces niveus TaxID=193462 RepID=UPI0033DFB90E